MKSVIKLFGILVIVIIGYILYFFTNSNILSARIETKLNTTIFNCEKNYPYTPIIENEFPIIASYPCPSNKSPRLDDFLTIRECGFNIISYALSYKLIDKAIELARESNSKLILRSGSLLRPQYRDFIKKYIDTPEIVGWYIKDEPTFIELDSINFYYHNIWSIDSKKLSFINLVGSDNKKFIGNNKNYTDYLIYIQKNFHPALWCYDFYPISKRNGKIIIDYNNFYSNLEIYSTISKLTKRPFWAYCQCMAFKNNKVYRPIPTIPYLRFEAFSALAYGAQGIVYWAYAQQTSLKNEEFISAPINLKGEKTTEWFYVQKVNKEIKSYTEVFLNSVMIDCIHTGKNLIKNAKQFNGEFGPIRYIKSENTGILISLVKNHNKKYIIIVNHDVTNSQSINLTLNSNFRYLELLPSFDKKNSLIKNYLDTNIRKSLTPGGYMIIEYRKI